MIARKGMWAVVWLVGVAGASFGAEPEKAASDELKKLRGELASLRQDLARAQLELRRAVAEVGDLKEFLAAEDPEAQADAWRAEREELEAERQRLVEERRRIEAERRRVRLEGQQPPPPVPPEEQAGKPRYDLDYTLSYIRTGDDDRAVYIEFGDLLVPADSRPDIDREHVMVRGTMQNLSGEPWRYTFEVRIADRQGNALGKWRYQTPTLGPSELHPFEIKVPVTDANLVGQYQIGNIESDQPEGAKE